MFSSSAIDGLINVVTDEAVPLGLVQPQVGEGLSPASLMRLADTAFSENEWSSAASLYMAAITSRGAAVDYMSSAIRLGRSLLYTRDFGAAARILETAADNAPDEWDAQFYCGRALQYLGDYEAALQRLTMATVLRSDRSVGFLALAETAHAMGFGGYGVAKPAGRDMFTLARLSYGQAISLDKGQLAAHIGLIRLFGEQLDLDQASAAYRVGLKATDPKSKRTDRLHMEMAMTCCRLGAYDQARALVPDLNRTSGGTILARRIERLLCHVPSDAAGESKSAAPLAGTANLPWFVPNWSMKALAAGLFQAGSSRVLTGEISIGDLAALESAFLVIGPRFDRGRARVVTSALQRLDRAIGGIRLSGADNAGSAATDLVCVRRSLLIDLLVATGVAQDQAVEWDTIHDLALARIKLRHMPDPASQESAVVRMGPDRTLAGQVVVLLSRSGFELAGGGDQFLQEAGAFYRADGARTITLGLSPDGDGALQTHADGTRFACLPEDPSQLRQWLIANGVTMLHTMSGLGQLVIDAVEGLNLKLVYGVHHWREFILSPAGHAYYFPSIGQSAAPSATPEFRSILSRFDIVYANSDYVRAIARDLYHVDLPIIPSVVRDDFATEAEGAHAARDRAFIERTLGRDFVLLANARHDKGFSLIVEVASRLPEIPFVVIASQSQGQLALRAVHRSGLGNIKVIERVRDMRPLYDAAKVVAVPSYEFAETFGRVAIEASRFGKPVLLADSGNLTNLSVSGDDLLPQDPQAWADAIRAIYTAPAVAERHRAAAAERSARYGADRQQRGFAMIADVFCKPRVLVAVGSGIGNICHTTPLIKALSDHYGTAIDVLMCGDYDGVSCLFGGSESVGTVFESIAALDGRAYDLALITHCYGSVTPQLNARHVIESRAIAHFEPGGEEHEAHFNLNVFAPRIDGFDPQQIGLRYFLGGWSYRRPGHGRIAMHAGCKKGNWVAKRWPYFAELATRLRGLGYEVASVGTEDEYVPGTLDLTGGSIETMIDRLTTCDLVISNDSGVMNLANALEIPLVALFGPTNAETRGPFGLDSRIVAVKADCSPCEISTTHIGKFKSGACDCMRAIGVEHVLEAALTLANKKKTPAQAA